MEFQNQSGLALLNSKMSDLSGLYQAYFDSMENGKVEKEDLDRMKDSTNKLQAEVDTLKVLLEAKMSDQRTEKGKGLEKKEKSLSSPSSPSKAKKTRRRSSIKSTKYVADSGDESNRSKTKPAKSKLADDLRLSDDDEIQLHNNEQFEDDEKPSCPSSPSKKPAVKKASTVVKSSRPAAAAVKGVVGSPSKVVPPPPPPSSDDCSKFVRQPLNLSDDSSDDSDDSRLSRKRNKSPSTDRSSSRGSSTVKSCSPPRVNSPSPKRARGNAKRSPSPPLQPIEGSSKYHPSPKRAKVSASPIDGSSPKDDPRPPVPIIKVLIDPAGQWMTLAARKISNLPSNPNIFDAKSLVKPKLRMCSYFQWDSCRLSNRMHHDDKFDDRWVHGCVWCYRTTNTIQPHPVKVCPFIKLNFVET